MTLGGWAFEKGKRGPNESKLTLFTIGTAFLASGLNVTINERNVMFEKKMLKKYEFGGPFKGSKRVLMGQKLIKTYFSVYKQYVLCIVKYMTFGPLGHVLTLLNGPQIHIF